MTARKTPEPPAAVPRGAGPPCQEPSPPVAAVQGQLAGKDAPVPFPASPASPPAGAPEGRASAGGESEPPVSGRPPLPGAGEPGGSSPARLLSPGIQPRTWTIELEPGTPILTANHRKHRYAAGARTKQLRAVAYQLANAMRLPVIEQAEILVQYNPPPRLKRDRHPLASERIEDSENLQPTAKALVDGIVQAGVLASDSRRYVRHVVCEMLPETHPRGLVTVHITEVAL
jgi:crossover junction endodeoxyribonuclease RusA